MLLNPATLPGKSNIDPLGQHGRDHCFRTCCPSVPTIQKRKKNQGKPMFATGVTVGLAEWIIDDTCLV